MWETMDREKLVNKNTKPKKNFKDDPFVTKFQIKKSITMPDVASNIIPLTVSDKLSVTGLNSACGHGSSRRSSKQGTLPRNVMAL